MNQIQMSKKPRKRRPKNENDITEFVFEDENLLNLLN